MKKCFYCGEDATCEDHIVPLSFYYSGKRKSGKHLTSEHGRENLIDSCSECNILASDSVFDGVYKKKEYIQKRLAKKYKKVINSPFWDENDIRKMGRKLRTDIRIQQLARNWILNRVNYPEEMYQIHSLNADIREFLTKHL